MSLDVVTGTLEIILDFVAAFHTPFSLCGETGILGIHLLFTYILNEQQWLKPPASIRFVSPQMKTALLKAPKKNSLTEPYFL